MHANRILFTEVAALVFALNASACGGSQESVADFIDDADPVDLSDRAVVERALVHAQPQMVILESVLGLAMADDWTELDGCPRIIDDSDPYMHTVHIEYRGDGCTFLDGDTEITVDGSLVIEGDVTGTTLRYESLVLTSRDLDEPCEPWTERIAMLGTVRLPGAPFSSTDDTGHYDVLYKLDIGATNEDCERLMHLIVAHDYRIDVAVTDDEHWVYDQVGRTAGLRIGVTSGELDPEFDVPIGAYALTATDLEYAPAECGEPLGGSITLRAADNTALIQPNGASECDGEHCAPWILNGQAQPEPVCGIQGLGCTVTTDAGRGGLGVWLLLAVAALSLGSSRKRRCSRAR